MEDFGKKLGRIIDASQLDHVEIAKRALGERSTEKARYTFANYISRMRADRVPSPGLIKLEALAKGLSLNLPEFFLQLEGKDTPTGRHPGGESAPSETTVGSGDDDGALHGVRSAAAAEDRLAHNLLIRIGSILIHAAKPATPAKPETRGQAPVTRVRRSGSAKGAGGSR